MFRSRKTGRITLAQFPNWSLGLWFITSAVLALGQPRGVFRGALVVLGAGALVDPSVVVGDQVGVVVRSRTEPFDVVKPPFVTPGVRDA